MSSLGDQLAAIASGQKHILPGERERRNQKLSKRQEREATQAARRKSDQLQLPDFSAHSSSVKSSSARARRRRRKRLFLPLQVAPPSFELMEDFESMAADAAAAVARLAAARGDSTLAKFVPGRAPLGPQSSEISSTPDGSSTHGQSPLAAADDANLETDAFVCSPAAARCDLDVLEPARARSIDQAVARLLKRIGFYLPTTDALIVLEWLVQRFRAHARHTETLVRCCLIHVGRPVFARVLAATPPVAESSPLAFLYGECRDRAIEWRATEPTGPSDAAAFDPDLGPLEDPAGAARVASIGTLARRCRLDVRFARLLTSVAVGRAPDDPRWAQLFALVFVDVVALVSTSDRRQTLALVSQLLPLVCQVLDQSTSSSLVLSGSMVAVALARKARPLPLSATAPLVAALVAAAHRQPVGSASAHETFLRLFSALAALTDLQISHRQTGHQPVGLIDGPAAVQLADAATRHAHKPRFPLNEPLDYVTKSVSREAAGQLAHELTHAILSALRLGPADDFGRNQVASQQPPAITQQLTDAWADAVLVAIANGRGSSLDAATDPTQLLVIEELSAALARAAGGQCKELVEGLLIAVLRRCKTYDTPHGSPLLTDSQAIACSDCLRTIRRVARPSSASPLATFARSALEAASLPSTRPPPPNRTVIGSITHQMNEICAISAPEDIDVDRASSSAGVSWRSHKPHHRRRRSLLDLASKGALQVRETDDTTETLLHCLTKLRDAVVSGQAEAKTLGADADSSQLITDEDLMEMSATLQHVLMTHRPVPGDSTTVNADDAAPVVKIQRAAIRLLKADERFSSSTLGHRPDLLAELLPLAAACDHRSVGDDAYPAATLLSSTSSCSLLAGFQAPKASPGGAGGQKKRKAQKSLTPTSDSVQWNHHLLSFVGTKCIAQPEDLFSQLPPASFFSLAVLWHQLASGAKSAKPKLTASLILSRVAQLLQSTDLFVTDGGAPDWSTATYHSALNGFVRRVGVQKKRGKEKLHIADGHGPDNGAQPLQPSALASLSSCGQCLHDQQSSQYSLLEAAALSATRTLESNGKLDQARCRESLSVFVQQTLLRSGPLAPSGPTTPPSAVLPDSAWQCVMQLGADGSLEVLSALWLARASDDADDDLLAKRALMLMSALVAVDPFAQKDSFDWDTLTACSLAVVFDSTRPLAVRQAAMDLVASVAGHAPATPTTTTTGTPTKPQQTRQWRLSELVNLICANRKEIAMDPTHVVSLLADHQQQLAGNKGHHCSLADQLLSVLLDAQCAPMRGQWPSGSSHPLGPLLILLKPLSSLVPSASRGLVDVLQYAEWLLTAHPVRLQPPSEEKAPEPQHHLATEATILSVLLVLLELANRSMTAGREPQAVPAQAAQSMASLVCTVLERIVGPALDQSTSHATHGSLLTRNTESAVHGVGLAAVTCARTLLTLSSGQAPEVSLSGNHRSALAASLSSLAQRGTGAGARLADGMTAGVLTKAAAGAAAQLFTSSDVSRLRLALEEAGTDATKVIGWLEALEPYLQARLAAPLLIDMLNLLPRSNVIGDTPAPKKPPPAKKKKKNGTTSQQVQQKQSKESPMDPYVRQLILVRCSQMCKNYGSGDIAPLAAQLNLLAILPAVSASKDAEPLDAHSLAGTDSRAVLRLASEQRLLGLSILRAVGEALISQCSEQGLTGSSDSAVPTTAYQLVEQLASSSLLGDAATEEMSQARQRAVVAWISVAFLGAQLDHAALTSIANSCVQLPMGRKAAKSLRWIAARACGEAIASAARRLAPKRRPAADGADLSSEWQSEFAKRLFVVSRGDVMLIDTLSAVNPSTLAVQLLQKPLHAGRSGGNKAEPGVSLDDRRFLVLAAVRLLGRFADQVDGGLAAKLLLTVLRHGRQDESLDVSPAIEPLLLRADADSLCAVVRQLLETDDKSDRDANHWLAIDLIENRLGMLSSQHQEKPRQSKKRSKSSRKQKAAQVAAQFISKLLPILLGIAVARTANKYTLTIRHAAVKATEHLVDTLAGRHARLLVEAGVLDCAQALLGLYAAADGGQPAPSTSVDEQAFLSSSLLMTSALAQRLGRVHLTAVLPRLAPAFLSALRHLLQSAAASSAAFDPTDLSESNTGDSSSGNDEQSSSSSSSSSSNGGVSSPSGSMSKFYTIIEGGGVALKTWIQSLGTLLSPWMAKIIGIALDPLLRQVENSSRLDDHDLTDEPLGWACLEELVAAMPCRLWPRPLPAACARCLDNRDPTAVALLLRAVRLALGRSQTSDAVDHIPGVTRSLLLCVDQLAEGFAVAGQQQQQQNLSSVDDDDDTRSQLEFLDSIEQLVSEAFVDLSLQLSAPAFRPVFVFAVTWATDYSRWPAGSPAQAARSRLFYDIVARLARKLKSLFAGHVSLFMSDLLDVLHQAASDLSAPSGLLLWPMAAQALRWVASCGDDGLPAPTKSTKTPTSGPGRRNNDQEPPSINPWLESATESLSALLGIARHKTVGTSLVDDAVIPALIALATTTSHEHERRFVHKSVFLASRHRHSRVRLAAIRCASGLFARLSMDQALTLIPEAVPFLAELADDEQSAVAAAATSLVTELEGILGTDDGLSAYF